MFGSSHNHACAIHISLGYFRVQSTIISHCTDVVFGSSQNYVKEQYFIGLFWSTEYDITLAEYLCGLIIHCVILSLLILCIHVVLVPWSTGPHGEYCHIWPTKCKHTCSHKYALGTCYHNYKLLVIHAAHTVYAP